MASGTFFSPQKTLLLAPVVSSTCSLLFAWDQHIFLNLLTHPELSDRTNAILPTYWRVFFPRGLAQVVSFLGITTWTSIGAVVYHKALLQKRGALPWYVASATMAVAHLVFVPFVAPAIKYIMEDEGGRSRERKVAEPGNRNVDMQTLRDYIMKFHILTITAAICASTSANTVGFEEWLQPGCPGRAFLTANAASGYCVNLGDYPGKSIRVTEKVACAKSQSGWVEISSKECASFQVDGQFLVDGQCQDVDFEPLALRTSCR
ncbi:hypothetical protein VFPPC_05985 [Pochonia chlamydosporia 170]|uniref:Uncharacterized protein n=1 Tax=Pochonia chlamydosporia 170 TaxID=1380566 RepID=A0A179FGU5_METCM|nr:hypothetical protein VFPPC_05985 [Pochonia chlamydosporia 170]OAQ64754.1 hypothetical protein VFPPC_05985 [Pochonia chlamydosporia 170]